MTWKEIQPGEAKPGDYININGVHTPIVEANQFRVSYKAEDAVSSIDVQVAVILGVKFEREVEEHPHGLVPDVDWTHLVFGDGRHAVRAMRGAVRGWDWILQDGRYELRVSHKTIQERADQHGFDVLRPDMEITEEKMERAARELWKVIFRRGEDSNQEWERNKPAIGAYFKAQARRILEAALGGEQA